MNVPISFITKTTMEKKGENRKSDVEATAITQRQNQPTTKTVTVKFPFFFHHALLNNNIDYIITPFFCFSTASHAVCSLSLSLSFALPSCLLAPFSDPSQQNKKKKNIISKTDSQKKKRCVKSKKMNYSTSPHFLQKCMRSRCSFAHSIIHNCPDKIASVAIDYTSATHP